MKGMVFLLYGLPHFLARAGPKGLGGASGKDMVGPFPRDTGGRYRAFPSCP